MAKQRYVSQAALTPLPRNLCEARNATARVYEVLGHGEKLPKTFKGKFNVDGHTVVVFPSRSTRGQYAHSRRYKPKRVRGRKYGLSRMFFLLKNGDLVPTGRIMQTGYCGGRGGQTGKGRRAGPFFLEGGR